MKFQTDFYVSHLRKQVENSTTDKGRGTKSNEKCIGVRIDFGELAVILQKW